MKGVRVAVVACGSASCFAIDSQTILNSLPSTKDGKAISRSPNTSNGTVINRPKNDRGVISPYPTVVIVTRTNQAAAGIEGNWDGSPSELMNVSSVSSQVPRSAKYSRVLNTVSTMAMKKLRASNAWCDLLMAKYMTSIVKSMVLLYLNGLKTRNKRNILRIEKRNMTEVSWCSITSM